MDAVPRRIWWLHVGKASHGYNSFAIKGGADDILEDHEEKTTDLLVMRPGESISKGLEESSQWRAGVLSEERKAKTTEIEELEEQARYDWLKNHGIVDDAGQGRCSFHFCRKLFKDANFLRESYHCLHRNVSSPDSNRRHSSLRITRQPWKTMALTTSALQTSRCKVTRSFARESCATAPAAGTCRKLGRRNSSSSTAARNAIGESPYFDDEG
jgi:hypothetical protein